MANREVRSIPGGLGPGTRLSVTGAQAGGEIRGCVSNYTGVPLIVTGGGQCRSSG